MRYRRRNTLIADDPADPSWTRLDGRSFHNYAAPVLTPGAQPALIPAGAAPAGGTAPRYGADRVTSQKETDEYPWVAQCASILLTAGNQGQILIGDNYRNLLIFQNQSTASASGDVAPVLYIGLDGPVKTPFTVGINNSTGQFAFALAPGTNGLPGVGLVLDVRVPRNALYFAYGTFTNTGGSVFIGGICTYGRTTNSPPLPPAPTGFMAPLEQARGINSRF